MRSRYPVAGTTSSANGGNGADDSDVGHFWSFNSSLVLICFSCCSHYRKMDASGGAGIWNV